MDTYAAVLFIHVAAAMGLAAAVATMTIAEGKLREAHSVQQVRSLSATIHATGQRMRAMAVVILAAGLYLAHAHWSLTAPWVITSILVVVYLTLTGRLVFRPRIRAVVTAAESAGALTPTVRTRLRDPILARMGAIRNALFVLLVFMMTTKPGLLGVLVAAGIALVTGVLVAEMRRVPSAAAVATE
ncbi:MAG: hypothetical protein ABJE47_09545 [bacterium]